MTTNLGPGVSRVLLSAETQYAETIWQQGKPPCDGELNLMQAVALETTQSSVLRGMPSGFLGGETNLQKAFVTNPAWSNYFKFGPQRDGEIAPFMWANVNGWLIPVTGTGTGSPPGSPNNTDYSNVIALDPPPGAPGDFRIDFVFLEVWRARVQPNPSTTNKPSASAIFRFGNVEGGFSYLPDDLVDPAIGFETNQRVQIQYRIRVVKGLVGLSSNPDGFDKGVVKAQGAAATQTSYWFENMRQALGDPGLWRAGDGTQNLLGTVDGYSYAVPISVVFRRNSVGWAGNPAQNLNGGFNRNPAAANRTGIKTFVPAPALLSDVTATATSFPLGGSPNIALLPLPANPPASVLIQVDDELMLYQNITGTTINIAPGGRGSNGTVAGPHKAGAVIRVVSGRPDGLFSDQIASTDILDLRHSVNPNGFDYDALLKGSLDRLLRGQLRANWKLSGTGPRGAYVSYQDAITAGSLSLGVTKLDAPDNIRLVFSDAATIQPVELVCSPNGTAVTSGSATISLGWSLGITVNTTSQNPGGQFKAGNVLVIPVNQLKNGLQAGSTDQVRWLNDNVLGAVRLRFDGETSDLPPTLNMYKVEPEFPTSSDDLVITLGTDFPVQATTAQSPRILHIRAHIVYGAGRGLARRPDAIHSVSYITPSADLLTQQWGVPTNNKGARVAWAPLWSKYRGKTRDDTLNGSPPVTAEMYADLGSKTVVVSPFRRIDFPQLLTMDGRSANYNPTPRTPAATTGTLGVDNGTVINVASGSVGLTALGDALVVPEYDPNALPSPHSGVGAGRYTVTAVAPTSITVERPIRAKIGSILNFTIHPAQGLMPLYTPIPGADRKWTQTDPLRLFCGTSASTTGPTNAAYESIYVSLPRHLVPAWGEVHVPILATATGTFQTGINYMVRTSTAAAPAPPSERNYAAYYSGGGSNQYSVFSQQIAAPGPGLTDLAYNTAALGSDGNQWAGIRFFTDARGLGRKGLEFPPFYGIARIFGVYQVSDFVTVGGGSPFSDTRQSGGTGTTVNLLRQSMGPQDGPPMWIETDADGDSTFILNAKAIDISKATTPIADFASGKYLVEAVVFGFDRGSFNLDKEFRLVLTRPGSNTNSWSTVGGANNPVDTNPTTGRANNINRWVDGLAGLLPGPAEQNDQIVVNYSRTPYQGDAWGSQTNSMDISYSQGPLSSDTAYQLSHTHLDTSALTRPNQKVLEVLAATSFSTDLGTGRYSADAVVDPLDFKNVAYEDQSAYPPATSGADRPIVKAGNFVAADVTNIGSEYLGCTERLPLGALFRDKDFRGQAFSNQMPSGLIYADVVGSGPAAGLAAPNSVEQRDVPLSTGTSGVGSPGDILVHVDGEEASPNYGILTNYRVTRGGSVFTASGPYPGGALSLQNVPAFAQTSHVNVVHGRAMLVRNAVTNVGLNEVSAGDELMMLIVTSVQHRPASQTLTPSVITIGTNGAGEGYSAADLYRIDGHPLVRNNVHMQVNPDSIALTRGS